MYRRLTIATECGVGPVISLVRLFFTTLSSIEDPYRCDAHCTTKKPTLHALHGRSKTNTVAMTMKHMIVSWSRTERYSCHTQCIHIRFCFAVWFRSIKGWEEECSTRSPRQKQEGRILFTLPLLGAVLKSSKSDEHGWWVGFCRSWGVFELVNKLYGTVYVWVTAVSRSVHVGVHVPCACVIDSDSLICKVDSFYCSV